MLVRETETRNFSAVSAVDVKDGTGMPVMAMNASISADGKINFSHTISDSANYLANQQEVDTDWESFRTKVIKAVSE